MLISLSLLFCRPLLSGFFPAFSPPFNFFLPLLHSFISIFFRFFLLLSFLHYFAPLSYFPRDSVSAAIELCTFPGLYLPSLFFSSSSFSVLFFFILPPFFSYFYSRRLSIIAILTKILFLYSFLHLVLFSL